MSAPRRPRRRPRAVQLFEAKAREGWRPCARILEEGSGPLLVGFSGGADSAALLLWLRAFLPPERPLLAVHVQHGLRGPAAERDARHAARLCRERGIPFRMARVRVAKRNPRGLEDAARRARRRAFLAEARRAGARAIALAHTLDDQAETVLMHLFEGSGPAGLAGMRPAAPMEKGKTLTILRPLLRVRRSEARAYLRALGVKWAEDETNRDERRPRNLLRRRLWPLIERRLGPSAAEGAARSAERLAAVQEVLEEAAAKARAELLAEEGGEVRVSPLAAAAALPQAVRAGLWRAMLERARGAKPFRGRSALGRHLEALDRLALEGGPSARLDLPGGLQARREYGTLIVGPPARPVSPSRREAPLRVPGRTAHEGLGIALHARLLGEAPAGRDPRAALLDADLLGEGAVLRSRREGDRFHPAGAPGGRKLKDFLIDRKVPRAAREGVALLAVGGEVAWVIGHQVSEKFRARPGTKRLLHLRAEALE